MAKDQIEKELRARFVGKWVGVEESEQPAVYHVGIQDCIYVYDGFGGGWVKVMAQVKADMRETSRLNKTAFELGCELQQATEKMIGDKEKEVQGD